jgi:hypothetical protein
MSFGNGILIDLDLTTQTLIAFQILYSLQNTIHAAFSCLVTVLLLMYVALAFV